MGGRGSRSGGAPGGGAGGGAGVVTITPQIMDVQVAPNAQTAAAANSNAFSATDSQGYHDLYNGQRNF